VNRRFRLGKRTDFERVRRSGKSYAHPLIVLIALANELGQTRFGISAGRSVGGAVQRNRTKRRIRGVLTPIAVDVHSGWDLVFLARKGLENSTHHELDQAIKKLLARARLYP